MSVIYDAKYIARILLGTTSTLESVGRLFTVQFLIEGNIFYMLKLEGFVIICNILGVIGFFGIWRYSDHFGGPLIGERAQTIPTA